MTSHVGLKDGKGKKVLCVGAVGLHKLEDLHEQGAEIWMVAPDADTKVQDQWEAKLVDHRIVAPVEGMDIQPYLGKFDLIFNATVYNEMKTEKAWGDLISRFKAMLKPDGRVYQFMELSAKNDKMIMDDQVSLAAVENMYEQNFRELEIFQPGYMLAAGPAPHILANCADSCIVTRHIGIH